MAKRFNYSSGMDLRHACKLARLWGWRVENVPGTGDTLFITPTGDRVRVHGTRKDSSRAVTTLLRRHDPHQPRPKLR